MVIRREENRTLGVAVEMAFSRDSNAIFRGFRVILSDRGITRRRVEMRRWRSSVSERVSEMKAVVWRWILDVVVVVMVSSGGGMEWKSVEKGFD